ncbi:MAG: hypothetical protein KatS3mg031_2330 [Chitinophagales bacterium]|nr:MAG: hypothetical protein KatS3mg031_2330 [Chitinophagales bacterium]
MRNLHYVLVVILSGLLHKVSAQCNGRYASELFPNVTKTTVQYSHFTVRPNDGDTLKMDIYQPVGDTFPKRPVVIMAHGGTFIAGDRNEGTSVAVCTMLAKRGYVTASIDYRLANSQFELMDSLNALQIALRAVSDMKAAVRFFRKDAATDNLYRIDPEQIFVGGNSAGAVTALHVAYVNDTTELPDYIKTIIAQNGGIEGNSGNPGYPSHVSGVINLAGGINKLQWIEPNDVPLLSCHGDADQTVPYGCGNVLYSFLDLIDLCGSGAIKTWCDQVGTDNILLTFLGDGHVPWESNTAKRNQMLDQVAEFMKTYTQCLTPTYAGQVIPPDFKLNIHPNPSHAVFTIDITGVSEAQLEMLTTLGQTVLHLPLKGSPVTLPISHLAPGTYILKITTSGYSTARQLIKL